MDKTKEISVDQIAGHVVPELPLFLSKLDELFTTMLGKERYYELILGDLRNSIACDMVEDALGIQVNVIKKNWKLARLYLSLLLENAKQLLNELDKEEE